jgi:hypothetical protein
MSLTASRLRSRLRAWRARRSEPVAVRDLFDAIVYEDRNGKRHRFLLTMITQGWGSMEIHFTIEDEIRRRHG